MFSRLYSVSKGWKTFLFGIALIALPVLEYLQTVDTDFITKSPWFPVGIGAGVIALRVLTAAPIFRRYKKRIDPEE